MKNIELFISKLKMFGYLSSEIVNHLTDIIHVEKLPKKHLLLREGQIARRIYFIEKGSARCYYFTPDGRESTSWFMSSGDIMISVHSFLSQKPSAENIELLEDGILFSITWEQLQAIYKKFPEFNQISRLVTEYYYIESEKRSIAIKTKSAEQRYINLLQSFPNIAEKATLGQVASYIGVRQETLSRLRGKKSVVQIR